MLTDLPSHQTSVLYTFDKAVLPSAVYCVDSLNLAVNLRFPVEGEVIAKLDLRDSTLSPICRGANFLFVPQNKSLYYYRKGEGLFEKALHPDSSEKLITSRLRAYCSEHPQRSAVEHYGHGPVQISDSEIVYCNAGDTLEIFDMTNRVFRQLNLFGYEPWAYHPRSHSLICRGIENDECYLVVIPTLQSKKIQVEKPSRIWDSGVIASTQQDCFFYGQPTFSLSEVARDLCVYWIDKNEVQRYMKLTRLWGGVHLPQH